MRIDLHTHSSVSDGTDSPAELVAAAVAAGLDVVALTDHDTTDGWAAAERARPAGLTVVPGMELSCRWFPGDGPPVSVHLLAYLFDPGHAGLAEERARLRAERLTRGERMVALLVAAGHPISWEALVRRSAGGVVGRPHVARALVDAGVVASVDEAFATLLHHHSPYYVAKADTDVLDGIRLVRQAGGVPVFAHGLARSRGRVVGDDAMAAMAAVGLLGLEVDHPDHEPDDRAHLRGLAADLGLVATGSSDYHGTNKRTPIAACTTDPGQYEALVALGTGRAPATG
ncbi:PHP domain-containing protein [Modestobacter sp. I12A-02628]|uniref:PHP domain-containing protein n=1 Tax=Goekera deserti TaxID=2497753 RepID=A0A7K3W965_9ACTN|nr:PHP domain-containing protein [Goekera deserti]MPQ99828.1 PHP domain-containing protein [Goekera deserti]NDI49984.1 PHP domain-containing protein [Goekera deserti]NEL52539.1 PHP domain-containing protein [Goekera deserti]